jgi:glycine cleavage system regulatory protein
MQQLIATIIGADRPGIVDGLAHIVQQYQGNWMASSLSELAGQFAGIIQCSVDDANVDALTAALKGQPGLNVTIALGGAEATVDEATLKIRITANDRQGIVSEVTRAISERAISLMHIETSCHPAPNWGGRLFEAKLEIAKPSAQQLELLQDALEALTDDLIVDIDG